jgi:excisionase family DNA binding protein
MTYRSIEERLDQIEQDVREVKKLLVRYFAISDRPSQKSEDALLNVKDVANLAKIEPGTVYYACMKKEIRFMRIGRSYKFKKEDVLKWMNGEREARTFQEVNVDEYVDNYLQKHILKG